MRNKTVWLTWGMAWALSFGAFAEQPPDEATFQFQNLTPQFRIRVDGRDYTERSERFVKEGTLSLKTKKLPDGRPRTSVVEIETVQNGERRTWKKRVFYGPGDFVRLDPTRSEDESLDVKGHLRFFVTLDTRIFINGKLTLQEGEIRDFHTPEIRAGQTYPVKVKFDYRNKTGRRIIRTKTWNLHPGERIVVDNIETLSEAVEIADSEER